MHVSPVVSLPQAQDFLAFTLCRNVERQTATRIAAQGSHHKVHAGQILFHEGDESDCVYEVIRGMVKLYKLLPDGRRQITGFVSAGDLMGLCYDESFIHTAEAVTDVVVFCFPKARFERMLSEVPAFARALLDATQQELRAAQDQMLLLGRKTATERIASFLLTMAERYGDAGCCDTMTFAVPMKRSDIADYLGLTIETVSRGLSRLKKADVIVDFDGGRMMQVHMDRLSELASGDCSDEL